MIKYYLWNYCDEIVGFHPKRFKIAAFILHLIGCDYWYSSVDYHD